MNNEKVHVSRKRTSLHFLIAFLVTGALLFLILLNFFIFTPFGTNQIIVISVFLGVSVFFYILAILNHYYLIGKPGIIYQKFTKRREFLYDDIIYIDREKSDASDNIVFITKFAETEMSIPKDNQGIVYDTLLKRCKHLVSKEELDRMFPNKRK